jgi:hypothetical protein
MSADVGPGGGAGAITTASTFSPPSCTGLESFRGLISHPAYGERPESFLTPRKACVMATAEGGPGDVGDGTVTIIVDFIF